MHNMKGKVPTTTARIARELGWTEDAVKSRLRSAMKKLRDGRAETFRELVEESERLRGSGEHILHDHDLDGDDGFRYPYRYRSLFPRC